MKNKHNKRKKTVNYYHILQERSKEKIMPNRRTDWKEEDWDNSGDDDESK